MSAPWIVKVAKLDKFKAQSGSRSGDRGDGCSEDKEDSPVNTVLAALDATGRAPVLDDDKCQSLNVKKTSSSLGSTELTSVSEINSDPGEGSTALLEALISSGLVGFPQDDPSCPIWDWSGIIHLLTVAQVRLLAMSYMAQVRLLAMSYMAISKLLL